MAVNDLSARPAVVTAGELQPDPPGPATCRSPRMRKIATWLFLLPVFSEGVFPGVVKVETAGMALLAFASVVIHRHPLPFRAFWRVYCTFAVLSLIVMGYLTFGSPPADGAPSAYLDRELMFIVTYTLVAVFAVMFFSLREFEAALWRAATIALWIGVLTCAASRATGRLILVNPDAGGLRMVGTLTEPSEWAPILAAVLILAFRRRSWLYALLALAGLLLADSPTCILVTIVSIALYALIGCRWEARAATILILCALAPLAAFALRDQSALLASRDPALVAVGRLASGVTNVETGGDEGANSRYTSVTEVTEAARDGGWLTGGAGPGADAVYFTTIQAEDGPIEASNEMWLSVLFDFGEWGVAVFALMLLAGVRGMRRAPAALAVFLPFFAAAMVNSSIPDWSVTALGIVLFAFGWHARPITARG